MKCISLQYNEILHANQSTSDTVYQHKQTIYAINSKHNLRTTIVV